ncbi:MAG: hypothetical protein M3032_03840 [Verrucomicrobiota bacterium]|nr:hypothetical protein [Verrucomicrobiota bacterium]
MLIGWQVSASENNKGARAGDSKDQKQETPNDQLIRLDDLIPKKSVSGGRQFVFGETDTEPPTLNTKE